METSPRRSQLAQQLDGTDIASIPHSKSESALQLPQISGSDLNVDMTPRAQSIYSIKDEMSRIASCSSLSSSKNEATTASLRRQTTVSTRAFNPLRGDSTLKIFLPNDNLALKAILSPKNTPWSSADEVHATSSSTLFDKILFRNSLPTTLTSIQSSGSVNEDEIEGNNIVIMNPHLPPPPFANMYACESCREDIGSLLSKGRHHCRNCGGSFCANCSTKVINIPYHAYLTRGELRVCDGCFHRIRNFHKQVKSTSVTWGGLHPPSIADLVLIFELADDEAPVSIFNCALFVETTPYYGHLILTRKRLCFQSYVDEKTLKVAYAQILSLLKPQFYYINGLQVKTQEKETFFLAEFNGLRDTCFLRLDQLIRAFQEASKRKSTVPGTLPSQTQLRQEALDRRRSYKIFSEHLVSTIANGNSTLNPPLSSSSPISTVGFIDVDEDKDVPLSNTFDEDGHLDDGKSTASDEEPFEPLPSDPLLDKMTVLLDCDLRADVKRVFELLWNDGPGQEFLQSNLEKARDIDIDIGSWQPLDKNNTKNIQNGFEISKENDYTLFRIVRSLHPPKTSFPGLPPYAGCTRTQRFRLDTTTNGGVKWDRFVITDLNRMSKIPFSDYFEVEMRYVFTRDGNNYCHVQVGLVVNFLKATWFKSQINSSTRSESKEAIEAWAKQAIEFLESQRHRVILPPPQLEDCSSIAQIYEEVKNETKGDNQEISESAITESCLTSQNVSTDDRALTSARSNGVDFVQSPRVFVSQLLFMGLLFYGLVLLRGQQTQMQQLLDATTKLLEHIQGQQTMMQTQIRMMQQTCDISAIEAATKT
ncbi:Membrane trafficking and cell signaling protein HRS, contains VHS and FYVE domains [Plasmopara halstedii]|uniref:Membrane trafficking and cell signaling protein HRS, contains VHS and FYVE domains n=1 Tax=Plasmopara halstedii TaxID=4781 RepID=A0A0P1AF38_PLAHL|nr:Membrane trafficking and cell signaling protein HRS, contains VHS and FYVE domains [Plasmopara halstedii]CEG39150.1 Membrane trafficking and cell signaling protein HRS, contains VHS and FYVE domains [Plasmopara halstedii]|eukprot:XP_024575519.1 Membrane trafficking and cell signaling protein HRS, contains VHS and FYVE domains [Plasmopara halstedii]